MAAPAAYTAHGNFPTIKFIEDSADILMKSITRTVLEDEELMIASDLQAINGAIYFNRRLEFKIEGNVASWSGFATQLSGTSIAAAADVPGWPATGSVHGFAGDTGTWTFHTPETRDSNTGKMVDFSATIKHHPYNGA